MRTRLSLVTALWMTAYGLVHVWWAVAGPPRFEGFAGESVIPGRWTPVVLAAVGATVAALVGRDARRQPATRWGLTVAGWATVAGFIAYDFLFVIDVMALVTGDGLHAVGLVARSAGIVAAILLSTVTLREQRTARNACTRCGRVHEPDVPASERRGDPAPWWAYLFGYLAIAGCLARFGAQAVTGFEGADTPIATTFVVVVVLLFLAGTFLPLALMHRWGRIWPAWVLPWAGKRVPRWIVLTPALFIGAGLTGYFGIGATTAILQGQLSDTSYPLWWTLLVIPGYVVWGVGLLGAAVSYFVLTKPACPGKA